MSDNSNSTIINLSGASIFQGKHLVLSDVDFEVSKGEVVYLIGKTGSGKSSLLRTLYGDLPLRHGSGMVAGFDLRKLKAKKIPYLRRKLGVVFQDFQLLMDRTVANNLYFVLKATGWKNKAQMQTRVESVLKLVGLQTKDFKYPHELSGGEQQRVVIARALLNNPELILADEPTGNLDPDTSNEILELLLNLSQEANTAMVIATHNYTMIENYPARIIKVAQAKLHDFPLESYQSQNSYEKEEEQVNEMEGSNEGTTHDIYEDENETGEIQYEYETSDDELNEEEIEEFTDEADLDEEDENEVETLIAQEGVEEEIYEELEIASFSEEQTEKDKTVNETEDYSSDTQETNDHGVNDQSESEQKIPSGTGKGAFELAGEIEKEVDEDNTFSEGTKISQWSVESDEQDTEADHINEERNPDSNS